LSELGDLKFTSRKALFVVIFLAACAAITVVDGHGWNW
jgi:hypothetical protein